MFLNGSQVVGAARANYFAVFCENLVVQIVFWEMLADEAEKLSADVCLQGHAVGRIRANYVSLSALAVMGCRFLAFGVG